MYWVNICVKEERAFVVLPRGICLRHWLKGAQIHGVKVNKPGEPVKASDSWVMTSWKIKHNQF